MKKGNVVFPSHKFPVVYVRNYISRLCKFRPVLSSRRRQTTFITDVYVVKQNVVRNILTAVVFSVKRRAFLSSQILSFQLANDKFACRHKVRFCSAT